jgi:hypothetical protein
MPSDSKDCKPKPTRPLRGSLNNMFFISRMEKGITSLRSLFLFPHQIVFTDYDHTAQVVPPAFPYNA